MKKEPQIMAPRVTPLEGVSTYAPQGIGVRGVENPQGFGIDERRFTATGNTDDTDLTDFTDTKSVRIRVIRAIRVPVVYSPASILPTTARISLSLSACERMNPASSLSQSDMSWSNLATMRRCSSRFDQ